MPGGIVAQYGFLYQKYVFLNFVLAKLGMDKSFIFEGVDDIDIMHNDDTLFKISDERNKYIQVKSGKIDKQCFARVIGNWMLEEEKGSEDGTKFLLIAENDISFDICDTNMSLELTDIYRKSDKMKRNSIFRRMYEKYKSEIISGEFDKKVLQFINQISVEVYSQEKLLSEIENLFIRTYCDDISVYEIAKMKRYERFEQYIFAEIDEAIKNKKRYIIDYASCIRIIGKCRDEISDQHYKVEFKHFKKKKKEIAEKLVQQSTMREVNELKYVNSDVSFVVNEIIKEMFYKELREVYIFPREIDISNIEETAKENYYDSKFKLGSKINAHDLFYETVEKNINSTLMENSPIYRHGCYVYLTGENIDEELQITWRCDDE